MRRRLLLFVVVGVFTAGCNGSPPPPPPPPPPTTTIPPPPPIVPEPKDYVNLQRVERLIEQYTDYPITWQCWRDPLYVATHCSWACLDGDDPVFDMTVGDMIEFAGDGMLLDAKRESIILDLPKVNRRCNPDHPEHEPGFCGRSKVRKTREAALHAEIEIAVALAEELREVAQQDPIREVCQFDSIRGHCECRNKHGGPGQQCENGGGR